MSPPQNEINSPTKKAQRIKKPKTAYQPKSIIKKSANTNETPPSSQTTAKGKKTVTFVDKLDDEASQPDAAVLQIHREHVTVTILQELQQKKDDSVEKAINEIYLVATKQLQNEIMKDRNEHVNVTPIADLIQRAKDCLTEKLRFCKSIENELEGNYRTTLNTLVKKESELQPKSDNHNKVIESIRNEEIIFDRNSALIGQKLDKLNTKFDFVTNERNNICEQIVQMNKSISGIKSMYQNIRQSNEKMENKICEVERKLANEEESINFVAKNALQWIAEKTVAVNKMKYEKTQLKKSKKKINASLKSAKIENNNLTDKVNTLTEDIAAKRAMLARIRNANKNLLDGSSSDVDGTPTRAVLSADSKQLSDRIETLQAEMDKKQQLANYIKLRRTEIEKFRQNCIELKLQSVKLEEDKRQQENEVAFREKYIAYLKNRRMSADFDSSQAKRQRVNNKDGVKNDSRIASSSYNYDDIDDIDFEDKNE